MAFEKQKDKEIKIQKYKKAQRPKDRKIERQIGKKAE